jgi:hypothetical protein
MSLVRLYVRVTIPNADHRPIPGVNNCYKAAAKQIIAQGNAKHDNPAKLLGAASIVAFKPFALLSHYSASKWAVRGMTQAYAMEMAEHNITVNAYAPGIVGTAMWDLIDEELGKKKGAKKGDTIAKVSQRSRTQSTQTLTRDLQVFRRADCPRTCECARGRSEAGRFLGQQGLGLHHRANASCGWRNHYDLDIVQTKVKCIAMPGCSSGSFQSLHISNNRPTCQLQQMILQSN